MQLPEGLRQKEEAMKQRQKCNFDRRHAVQTLSPLQDRDEVYVPDRKQVGEVVKPVNSRSYEVKTPSGVIRRNRVMLKKLPSPSPKMVEEPEVSQVPSPVKVITGNPIQTPDTDSPKPPDLPAKVSSFGRVLKLLCA